MRNCTKVLFPLGLFLLFLYLYFDGGQLYAEEPKKSITQTDKVVAISAGAWHTCALTASGVVKCWGANWDGQLGNGTRERSFIPVTVTGLSSEIIAISSKYNHTCALISSGEVKCWGGNEHGQLGIGTNKGPEICGYSACSTAPVTVSKLNGVKAIATGHFHTCALMQSGMVKCWGADGTGQLGIGTNEGPEICIPPNYPCSTVPLKVSDLEGRVVAISAGSRHNCVLFSSGAVKCWGDNSDRQLGSERGRPFSSVPLRVSDLTPDIAAIAAGDSHTCVLTSVGAVKCWGLNIVGQLGSVTNVKLEKDEIVLPGYAYSSTPTSVNDLISNVVAISAGNSHTCALNSSGGVKCWGWNRQGQIGNGAVQTTSTFGGIGISMQIDTSTKKLLVVSTLPEMPAFHAGIKSGAWIQKIDGMSTDKMTLDEAVNLIRGKVGTKVVLTILQPNERKPKNFEVERVMVGVKNKHTSVITPVEVLGLSSGVTAISAGENHTCAIIDSNGIKCWGTNANGVLGIGTDKGPEMCEFISTDFPCSTTPVDVIGFGG